MTVSLFLALDSIALEPERVARSQDKNTRWAKKASGKSSLNQQALDPFLVALLSSRFSVDDIAD